MARPAKVIVLAGGNDLTVGIQRVTMHAWGYRVLTAADFQALADILCEQPVDLVVAWSSELVDAAKDIAPDVRVLQMDGSPRSRADVFASAKKTDQVAVRHYLKTMVVRKRGPKKAESTHQQKAQSAARAACGGVA
jgi:hypothetical protein